MDTGGFAYTSATRSLSASAFFSFGIEMDKKKIIYQKHTTHTESRPPCVCAFDVMTGTHAPEPLPIAESYLRVSLSYNDVENCKSIPFTSLSPPNQPSLIIEINIPISRGGH